MTAASMTFEDAIREVGFGRFQIKLLVLCGLGWAADAMEVLLISFVIPAVGKEWNLHASQLGLLGTAIFLGSW
jgi:MFS transporter, putative metabolite:H+ symporter